MELHVKYLKLLVLGSGFLMFVASNAASQLNIELTKHAASQDGPEIRLWWPAGLGSQLEETDNLSGGAVWEAVEEVPTLEEGIFSLVRSITNPEGFFRLRLATGDFQQPMYFTATNGAERIAVGDYNNDGNMDAVATSRSGDKVSLLLGDGTGKLGEFSDFAANRTPVSISTADFNEDGKDDLVVSRDDPGMTGVTVLIAGGSGFIDPVDLTLTDPLGITQSFVGHFNEDDHVDILTWNIYRTTILFGDGMGAFPTRNVAIEREFLDPSLAVGYGIGDVNGDDHLDLVVVNAGKGPQSVLGDGMGGMTTSPQTELDDATDWALPTIETGRVYSDGETEFDDLIISALTNNIYIVKSLGDGSFESGEKIPIVDGVGDDSVISDVVSARFQQGWIYRFCSFSR